MDATFPPTTKHIPQGDYRRKKRLQVMLQHLTHLRLYGLPTDFQLASRSRLQSARQTFGLKRNVRNESRGDFACGDHFVRTARYRIQTHNSNEPQTPYSDIASCILTAPIPHCNRTRQQTFSKHVRCQHLPNLPSKFTAHALILPTQG
jgi:hypothetical protein